MIFEEFAHDVEADLIVIGITVHNTDRIKAAYRPTLDRVTRRRLLVPKPYFVVDENGALQLHNVPVPIERPELNGDPGPLVELLKVLLKLKCREHHVAQKLVASTADLERLALDDKAPVPALQGWRREIFGEAALALKRGELALSAAANNIALIDLSARKPARS